MVKCKKFKCFEVSANQYWKSIAVTPLLAIDITWGGIPLRKTFRRITLTLHWLAWWVSLEVSWNAKQL